MPSTHLALLRGINVGGKNRLPMKDLVDLFDRAGCAGVRTYIQSGNVLFTASASLAARLPDLITTQISECFGYRIPVVLRTAEQLRDVVHHNPFLDPEKAHETLHVLFLKDRPEAHAVDGLDADRSRPDAFVVQGQEVYLWLPHGAADTKLTNAYFDAKLTTTSTGRNWRTVTTLLGLMEN